MKGKYIPFLVLPLFALFLVCSVSNANAHNQTKWGDVAWSSCVTTGPQCGTDNGIQTGFATCVKGGDNNICSLGTWVDSTYEHRHCDDWKDGQNQNYCHKEEDWTTWANGPKHGDHQDEQEQKVLVAGYFINPDTKNDFSRSCNTGVVQYDSCPIAGTCPKACGLSASQVDDGLGGKTQCQATNLCPIAGTCPKACGLSASEVDDGQGGKTQCSATAVCDKPEVLGTSTVVTAETGASNNILVYVVQTVLMLGTLVSGTLFVKKYII